MDELKDALIEVMEELTQAVDKFPSFHSPHEGYAVIKEELDELWDEIKKQYDVRAKEKMRHEARQVAAMALRFMIELTCK